MQRRLLISLSKRLAGRLPNWCQFELKRIHCRRQIIKGDFASPEPEYTILPRLIGAGDWVIDVGANIGHYTMRFSELVGASGRVIAFEPVPSTFSLLSANVQLFHCNNVTLINAAVSHRFDIAGMSIPKLPTGLCNYYEARIASPSESSLSVLTIPVDSLCLNRPIALIKIDAEGHEAKVLSGMRKLLTEQHPVLIVETDSKEIIENLKELGYYSEKMHDSPNILFT